MLMLFCEGRALSWELISPESYARIIYFFAFLHFNKFYILISMFNFLHMALNLATQRILNLATLWILSLATLRILNLATQRILNVATLWILSLATLWILSLATLRILNLAT